MNVTLMAPNVYEETTLDKLPGGTPFIFSLDADSPEKAESKGYSPCMKLDSAHFINLTSGNIITLGGPEEHTCFVLQIDKIVLSPVMKKQA